MLRRIAWRLSMIFMGSILLIVAICVITFTSVRELVDSANRIKDETYPMDHTVNRLMLAVTNQETSLRGYVLSGDKSYLEPYESGTADVERYMSLLKEHLRYNPTISSHAELALAKLEEVQNDFRHIDRLIDANQVSEAAVLLLSGKAKVDRFRTEIGLLNDDIVESMESAWGEQNRRASFAQELIIVSIVVSMLVILAMGYLYLTTRKALRATIESERRYRVLIDSTPDAVAVHQDGHVVFANPACTTLMGVGQTSQLVGQPIMKFVPAHLAEVVAARAYNAMKENEVGKLDEQFVRPDGTVIDVEVTAIGIPYQRKPAVLIICRDIGVRKEAERKLTEANMLLERLSKLDGLTGILNRRSFDERLASDWDRSRQEVEPLALILLDVDSFKEYNDHYGHQAGDTCLQMIAGIVEDEARKARGAAFRYGGEEFAVLLPGCDSRAGKSVADQIRRSVESCAIPHEGVAGEAIVTISVGVASALDYTGLEHWVQAADQALYRAKKQGRNSTVEAENG
ncbi:sensor domain-containing diguanylate cyclase [Cohnella panacarvi]|uniref:sensor domain-containing diguanylate cyclase n=1 Tax=Cohnella panacarvi TaxID=400776 RepID=UPI000478FA77|nr:diguanylate cyclase [Cohnella panacarvi]